jgi:hypothetical protein
VSRPDRTLSPNRAIDALRTDAGFEIDDAEDRGEVREVARRCPECSTV